MAIFDRLDKLTSRAVDHTFSVSFAAHPGKRFPNGRPEADPDREDWTGKGVFTENPTYDAIETGKRDRRGNDLRTLATGTKFELSVDRHRYPMATSAKQGDRILMDDTRKFEIITIEPDGLARIVFVLVEIKG